MGWSLYVYIALCGSFCSFLKVLSASNGTVWRLVMGSSQECRVGIITRCRWAKRATVISKHHSTMESCDIMKVARTLDTLKVQGGRQ